jgi:hypothetical protein
MILLFDGHARITSGYAVGNDEVSTRVAKLLLSLCGASWCRCTATRCNCTMSLPADRPGPILSLVRSVAGGRAGRGQLLGRAVTPGRATTTRISCHDKQSSSSGGALTTFASRSSESARTFLIQSVVRLREAMRDKTANDFVASVSSTLFYHTGRGFILPDAAK